ncbi:ANTAR domain-containing protein [Streptomyces sp. EN16]|uniref:ANTAR domain-containing protein n=1 Tax=Streptomyces sp. EN16 TaxID=212773 RepID=UPI00099F9122|nr:ANTAR domain-containing protein [Streptomyces sp. EN16]
MAASASPGQGSTAPAVRDGQPPPDGAHPAVDAARPPGTGDAGAELDQALEQVRQLEQALVSHAVIDQARGVLIALTRCSPEEAWGVLVNVSQHSNTKLRAVAGALVAHAQGERLPGALHRCLQQELRRRAGEARRSEGGA